MPKYIIKWNAGYGDSRNVIEAENEQKAVEEAYALWLEEADSNADYDAELLTPENAKEHGFENELNEATEIE